MSWALSWARSAGSYQLEKKEVFQVGDKKTKDIKRADPKSTSSVEQNLPARETSTFTAVHFLRLVDRAAFEWLLEPPAGPVPKVLNASNKGQRALFLLLSFPTADTEFSCNPLPKGKLTPELPAEERLTGREDANSEGRIHNGSVQADCQWLARPRGSPNLSHLNLAQLCTYRTCPTFFQQHPAPNTQRLKMRHPLFSPMLLCSLFYYGILYSSRDLENMPVISPWEAGEP